MKTIQTMEALQALYPQVKERSVQKQLPELDVHMRKFISKSPFLVISTYGPNGVGDCSPRGGAPGFVTVENNRLFLLPDWPGNNRLDSLTNIVHNPGIGFLFLIPGVNETLRINGIAMISVEEKLLERFNTNGKLPRSILCIEVVEAYLHCAKALMRAELWNDTYKIHRAELPTMGQMLQDQIGSSGQLETQSEMEARYLQALY